MTAADHGEPAPDWAVQPAGRAPRAAGTVVQPPPGSRPPGRALTGAEAPPGQRGAGGEPRADIVVGGSWRGHWGMSGDLVAARWRVAAVATVITVAVFAGWAGRVYLTGGWRYFAEHRSPLAPGLECPTSQGHAMPGPGLLAAIAELGRGTPPGAVARAYGCVPAVRLLDPAPRPPLPPLARARMR